LFAFVGGFFLADVERIFLGEKEIVLVGTAHVSRASIDLVKKTIEEEQPDAVGVELDSARFAQLKSGARWGETSIFKVISSGQAYLFLVHLLLFFLQMRIGQKLGIKPGEEMIEAINIAQENGKPVVLLDRDVNVTLKRAMAKTSFFEKLRLIFHVISGFFSGGDEITSEKVESLKDYDVLNELMQQLAGEFPSMKRVLVDERDAFIANRIMCFNGKKIVAVIGKGHMSGVKGFFEKKVCLRELSEVPLKRIFSWPKVIVPGLILGVFGYIFIAKGIEVTLTALVWWLLINGSFSAIGVLLARGHVLSALAAFLAAPFTSIHPLLAAGWFAGVVEAKIRSPTVNDFESLNKMSSFRDFSSNRVTSVLLVVAFANIGSTIGSFVAIPLILSFIGTVV
jgi:pheromone shutdown-related protein TraB